MATKKTAVKKIGKPEFDYTTIKTFEDACKKENIDPLSLLDVSVVPKEFRKALLSVYKLFVIFKAINNGWTPDWSNWNQYKYYPWFEVKATKALSSGFGFSISGYDFTDTDACVGSRLCTDASEKAKYIANQFQDEYKEFLLITE